MWFQSNDETWNRFLWKWTMTRGTSLRTPRRGLNRRCCATRQHCTTLLVRHCTTLRHGTTSRMHMRVSIADWIRCEISTELLRISHYGEVCRHRLGCKRSILVVRFVSTLLLSFHAVFLLFPRFFLPSQFSTTIRSRQILQCIWKQCKFCHDFLRKIKNTTKLKNSTNFKPPRILKLIS